MSEDGFVSVGPRKRTTDWREVKLGDVLTLQRGFDLPARDRTDGPFPVVSSSGVTGTHSQFKVEPPGVVIGRYGSLGDVHWITKRFWPLNTSLWVKDFKGNDPRFVSYLLRTVNVDGSTASAVPGVNRNHLHLLRVRVPGRAVQVQIAAVLAALDELIQINERRIEVLEDLARSLYREWFVQFRFPSHEDLDFTESELGPIPVTWAVGALSDFASFLHPSITPANHPNTWFEHFSIPTYDASRIAALEPGSSVKSNKYRVVTDCVLLSKINPRIERVWLARPSPRREAIASTEFLPWVGKTVPISWLWCLFVSESFRSRLVALAGGTSTSHQRAKPQDVAAMKVAVADEATLARFDATVDPMLRHAAELRVENARLSSMRDLLLPRLVTGKLDISDVDLGELLPTESA